jgi:predicted transcriptional regulator
MAKLTIDISEATHETLQKLAESSGESIQTILDRAIENYRRYIFLVQANQAFTAMKQNDALWQEEIVERQAWDCTVADGIEAE